MTRVHISLSVNDLERSVQFYNQVLGRGPDKRRDDYANYRVQAPGLMLSLVASKTPTQALDGGSRHYGVELESAAELEGWRERIATTELEMRREDDIVCCYALSDKFWLSDPDGNQWEFWVRKEDADAMHDPVPVARESASASGCGGSLPQAEGGCC